MSPRLLAVIVPVLATLIFGAGGGLLGPLLPSIAREFGIPLDFSSLLFAVMFSGGILSVMLGGYLSDRFGKRLLFLIAFAGLLAAYLLLAAAPTFALVVIACLLIGAMGGAIEGLCGAIIADVQPARVERNMNLLQVGFSAGAVTALLVASQMQTQGDNWRLPYGVIAAAAAGVLLLGFYMRVPPAPPGEPISLPIARAVLRDRYLLLLALAIMLYVGSEMSLAWWISPILEKERVYTTSVAVLGAGLFWFTMGVGRVITGLLCHRFSGHAVLKVLLLGGLLSYLLLLLPLGSWRLWAGVAAAGFTFSGVWPLIVGLGGGRYPQYSGTAISVLVASGTLGGMLFPTLIGFIIERGSATWGLVVMAGLFLLLTLLIWTTAPSRFPRVVDTAIAAREVEPQG